MALRPALFIAAIALALAGCQQHSSAYSKKRTVKLRGSHIGPAIAATPLSPVAAGYRHGGGYRQPATIGGTAYTLGSGDKLRVIVFGQENLSRTYLVDAAGYISMPLIGAVRAQGDTTFQLEQSIADSLQRKYVKDPKVTVEIEAYRPFFILGEVRNAGQYPYVADMTVQTAVAIAGGFTARARKQQVRLTRQVNGATLTQTVPANWKVLPGDTITVTERFF